MVNEPTSVADFKAAVSALDVLDWNSRSLNASAMVAALRSRSPFLRGVRPFTMSLRISSYRNRKPWPLSTPSMCCINMIPPSIDENSSKSLVDER